MALGTFVALSAADIVAAVDPGPEHNTVGALAGYAVGYCAQRRGLAAAVDVAVVDAVDAAAEHRCHILKREIVAAKTAPRVTDSTDSYLIAAVEHMDCSESWCLMGVLVGSAVAKMDCSSSSAVAVVKDFVVHRLRTGSTVVAKRVQVESSTADRSVAALSFK